MNSNKTINGLEAKDKIVGIPDIEIEQNSGVSWKVFLISLLVVAVASWVGRAVYEDVKFESELLAFENRIAELKKEKSEVEKNIENFDIDEYIKNNDEVITIKEHTTLVEKLDASVTYWKDRYTKEASQDAEVIVLPAEGTIPVDECRAYSSFRRQGSFEKWFNDRKKHWGVE